jgi:catechol 2,3-dioxygenase-like lactoylglutathione lyase family enzyme
MAIRELRLALTVADFGRADAFFRDAVGLEQLAEFHNDGGNGVLLEAGRATLEIFDEAQAEAIDKIEVGRRVAGAIRVALRIDDGDALARDLVQAGAEIIGGPVLTPWGDRNVRLVGPEAIQLTLFTPADTD